jgi:exopolyphosphatase/guanosine-5'-triphosphate,3'-diphosphate pyrophosphatase
LPGPLPRRVAAIDVGTNTVLLLVAEAGPGGPVALVERAEITRLGRGVDASGRLDPAAMAETVRVLADYAAEARRLGATAIDCVATSAARDASNGAEFLAAVQATAGLEPRIVSGDEEARLVWTSAWRDFGAAPPGPARLAVLDVGGGSTEFTFGDGPAPGGRRSLQVGAVRLTERLTGRHGDADPIGPATLAALRQAAGAALQPLGAMGGGGEAGGRLVGVAGTVTTLAAVEQALPVYDAGRVHGSSLARGRIEALIERLAALPLAERARLPGMEPKRADVIVAGAVVVAEAMALTGFERLTVSDRGVRWGLVHELLSGRRG